jgi:electron transport complex protein RnfE
MAEKTMTQEFTKGFIAENPVFILMLGLCPVLAVTTSVENGIGMGVASTFVLVCSNFIISLIRNYVPGNVRIPTYIVVIATFVTIADMVLKAYQPAIHASLGLFIPLIVVNCIILGRAEAFASKNTVGKSLIDGIGMGFGFTFALIILSSVREVLGSGTILGVAVPVVSSLPPFLIMILPPGAFLTLGLLLGLKNSVSGRS